MISSSAMKDTVWVQEHFAETPWLRVKRRMWFPWDEELKIEQSNMDSAWGKEWNSVSNQLVVRHFFCLLFQKQVSLQVKSEP